jgi:hypothetical protein
MENSVQMRTSTRVSPHACAQARAHTRAHAQTLTHARARTCDVEQEILSRCALMLAFNGTPRDSLLRLATRAIDSTALQSKAL